MGEKTVEKPKKKDAQALSHKAKRREIELKKAELELRSTEIDLELDQMTLTARRRDERRKKNEDHNLGIFRLEDGVGHTVATSLATEMQKWGRRNPGKPITLYICSPGGSVLHGFLLYDALRTLATQGHHITTIVRGFAASMGGVLFLAGDTRLIGAESFVHIHEVSSMTFGKLFEMKDDIAFSERLNKKIEDLYVSRTKVKRSDFRKKSQKTEWWIESTEAIALGIAHDVG